MHGTHFTSFREIIGVIGRNRVGLWCQYDPLGSESNNDVVQVKYTNQNVQFLHGNWAESLFRKEKAGNVHAFDRKRTVAQSKRAQRLNDLMGLSSSGSNQAR